jgi:5-methylcytosine-specific restriction endonuclease McrA
MDFDQLSDTQLVATVKQLAEQERGATAILVRSLAEVDNRRLYLRDGCSSLFTWCTQVLGLGEGAAYNRIEVARAGRRVPDLLAALDDGSLTLATARVLAPHVTPENHAELIADARHKSKREVERMVAAVHPLSEVGWCFTHVAPGRVRLHVTVSEDTFHNLRRAQELLRHAVPSGDLDQVLDRAVTVLISDLERRRFGATDSPRTSRALAPNSRHIPAAVRRAVVARDDGQCAFVGERGRCSTRGFLEFHHRQPYAVGGAATIDNIELRCRAHNQYEASVYFGEQGADVVPERAASD